MTVRGRLFLLVVVAAVPLLAFTVAMVLWNGASLRGIQVAQAARIADGGMQTVDRTIASAITGLQVLAASPALGRGDLQGFHAQARAAVGIASDRAIVLHERDGERIVSTDVPYGDPLPAQSREPAFDAALATGDATVTPLLAGAPGEPSVGVLVPVLRDGRVRHLISGRLRPATLSARLAELGVPPDWIVSVLDQGGTIVARTKDADRMVGRRAVERNWERIRGAAADAGSFEGRTQEGTPVLLSFTRSSRFGWATVVAIPQEALSTPTNDALSLVALAGLLTLLLAGALAWRSAKRIYLATDELVGAAAGMDQGRVVGPVHTGVAQFDQLADTMRHASARIREREAELSRSLEQLGRAHAELRREQEKKDQFIATLAHELRNPLAPIRMGVHLLNRALAEPQRAKTLAMITRQVNHMVRLVDDLMDVSRIARGLVRLERAPADLGQIVADAVDASEALFAGAGVACRLELPPQPVHAPLDVVRISQVLGNLLANAAKFTPAGGHVTVRLRACDGIATVEVADTGIGIPPDRLEQVFELFSQLGTTGAASPGLGIGLSLARRLVELHGGTLTATSAGEGAGATLTMRLPTTPPASRPPVDAGPAANTAPPRRHVLLVDDNRDAADSLASALRLAGHEVAVGHAAAEALRLAAHARVDVAFLDIGMPGMDGYELCRRLRRLPSCTHARLVALTGWGSQADRERARDAGFDAHLTKPVDWPEVAQQLDAPADRSRVP